MDCGTIIRLVISLLQVVVERVGLGISSCLWGLWESGIPLVPRLPSERGFPFRAGMQHMWLSSSRLGCL